MDAPIDPRACETPCPHNSGRACQWGAVADIANCAARKVPDPVDPVSGLRPRFVPKTKLPEGAICVWQGTYDWYWTSTGEAWTVSPEGGVHANQSWHNDATAAARALGLPLREPGGLAPDEEAWTDERLLALCQAKFNPGYDYLPLDWIEHGAAGRDLGLDNLRRWGNAKLGGWVCKRIPAKQAKAEPSPGPVELGTWHNIDLKFWPINGRVTATARYPEFTHSGWKPGEQFGVIQPIHNNALLTAYRRAVHAKLAPVPTGEWAWLMDEMPGYFDKYHATDQVWLGVDSSDPLHTYPWPISCEAESKRRAALLGLSPASAKDEAKARLERAGASDVRDCGPMQNDNKSITAYIYGGGKRVDLAINGLTLDQAVAALLSSRGIYQCGYCYEQCDSIESVTRHITSCRKHPMYRIRQEWDAAVAHANSLIEQRWTLRSQLAAKEREVDEWFQLSKRQQAQLAAAQAEVGRLKSELDKAVGYLDHARRHATWDFSRGGIDIFDRAGELVARNQEAARG